MATYITGIVARLSADDLLDTGNGMATLWEYPEDASDVVRKPLTRLTVFDIGAVVCINTKSKEPCKRAIVEAIVSHHAYGVMKAVSVNVVSVIE